MIIASSKEDKDTNKEAFGVKESLIKITGLPRYEILKDNYIMGEVLKKEFNRIGEIKDGRKLVLFAPTFRESNKSAIEQITNAEWRLLDEFAKEKNFLFGVRPHPYDINHLPQIIRESRNFYLFDSSEFTEPNILLKQTDVLIVDFTSIWIDYLLLKRPIIGFAKDYDHYLEKERGFVFDFEAIFPSHFLDRVDMLITEIKKEILIDNPISYKEITDILHDYDLTHDFSKDIFNQIEIVRKNG
jgi:CDP-glycerol glycerophosphotransferase